MTIFVLNHRAPTEMISGMQQPCVYSSICYVQPKDIYSSNSGQQASKSYN